MRPLHIVALFGTTSIQAAFAQGTRADYERAERFMIPVADTMVLGMGIVPRWIGRTDRFWYSRNLPRSREFILVDPAKRTQALAFDHQRLGAGLAASLKRPIRGDSLPIDSLVFSARGDSLSIVLRDTVATCSLADYGCVATRGQVARAPGTSPDGRWAAFVRGSNLFVREVATGVERQLTTDGTSDYAYATGIVNPGLMVAQGTATPRTQPMVSWSPDSKRFITFRMDTRRAGRLTMTQFAPPGDIRPRSYSYVYPLAGDSVLPTEELIIFEVDDWNRIPVQGEPLEQYYYNGFLPAWYGDSKRLRLIKVDRGYTTQRLYEIDAATGARRVVIEETATPYFDSYSSTLVETIRSGDEVLWGSQRDGWNHLYRYDGKTGQLGNQITRGDWVVREIVRVDTTRRIAYILAGGREPGRDPYLNHLYSVGLDGGAPRLLTPDGADHTVRFSPTGELFTDTYSRADLPPVTVVRRSSDGSVVHEVERADISRLKAIGWRPPEPFKVLARDGKTEIFGLIWRPTNFDSTRKYPVVENVYTGPHGWFVPKTFTAFRGQQQAIAELGFISIMIDAPGTAGRSRTFHDVSYKNLGGGTDEHPDAIRKAAATRPYMDLSRVGIWGHSAGGYDAAHAILVHPDFYKVAVSSAGDHDPRLDKAVWNTQWMGYPVGEHYQKQSNMALAGNLRGKLFLMHGDVDDNVPIAETFQLVDALIKANKNFDLLVMPGQNHGSGGTPYFIRRRWDYFVKHLLGVEPPSDYRIGGGR